MKEKSWVEHVARKECVYMFLVGKRKIMWKS